MKIALMAGIRVSKEGCRAAIDEGEPGDEGANHQQHEGIAKGEPGTQEVDLAKAESDDDVGHGGDTGEEDAAGHTLAVEHEEEAEINEGATCLLLEYNKYHRHHEQGNADEKVAPRTLKTETIATHEFGQSQ